jgi:hypothetical protein
MLFWEFFNWILIGLGESPVLHRAISRICIFAYGAAH